MSDRVQLDQANARYSQLENSYHKLLAQVQKLQTTHLSDLRNSESRFHTASSAMQQALVSKSEELVHVTNKLVGIQTRYERESGLWEKERHVMRGQLEKLSKDFSTLDHSLRHRDKSLTDSDKARKDLAERVAFREQDLIKYGKALRQRESELVTEREARIKFETQAIRLEDAMLKATADLNQTRALLEKRVNETVDYEKIKTSYAESKQELEDAMLREKNYSSEIEQLSARERKLFIQVEELNTQQRKYVNELSRVNSRHSGAVQELEVVKANEANMRAELDDAIKSKDAQNKEIINVESALRQAQNDGSRTIRELNDMHNALHEARQNTQNVQNELAQVRKISETAQGELDVCLHQLADAQVKIAGSDELRQQIAELGKRLEAETLAKLELRSQNKEKLLDVSHRITDLQSTLCQTKTELEELQKGESALRQTVRQREDAIKNQNSTIADLQNQMVSLQSQNSQTANDLEITRNRKREETLAIQEKFMQAKVSMEQDLSILRNQLAQKQSQINTYAEEAEKMRIDLSGFSSDRFSLEARVSELLASEQSYQRQIANLQAAVSQRGQENSRYSNKQHSLEDQIRRLEEELSLYRSGGAANVSDGEVHRLQNNMQQLSKRLQTQVDTLLEKEEGRSRAPSVEKHHQSKYITSPTVRIGAISPSPLNAPRLGNISQDAGKMVNEDFEYVDRLLSNPSVKP